MYGFKIVCEIWKVPFEISQKIWTHAAQSMHLTSSYKLWQLICDILELWHFKL